MLSNSSEQFEVSLKSSIQTNTKPDKLTSILTYSIDIIWQASSDYNTGNIRRVLCVIKNISMHRQSKDRYWKLLWIQLCVWCVMCSRSATVTFYLISLPFGLRTENPLHRKHQQPSQKSPKSAMFDSWTLDSFYEKDRPTHSKVTVGFLIFKKAVWLSGQLLLFALVCS